jgi:hypothetical protein
MKEIDPSTCILQLDVHPISCKHGNVEKKSESSDMDRLHRGLCRVEYRGIPRLLLDRKV